MRTALLLFVSAVTALAADPALLERGRQAERTACTPCHGLRIIHVQRLPRAAWERELDKMARWGWPGKEREALLEYLVANYSDAQPAPVLPLSIDGRSAK